jgi:FKBP-type peptidyl-prolyl cis-trans isomerase
MMKKLVYLFLGLSLTISACKKGSNAETSTAITDTPVTETPASQAPKPVTGPKPTPETMKMTPPFTIADSSKIVTTASGLKYYIVHLGEGNVPRAGQKIQAMYHGMLLDNTVFDSSYDRKTPFDFTVGQGAVIKGWDEAFTTFPVGTKAVIILPPDIAYGNQSTGKIPANSTLVFHVELLGAN